MCGAVARRCLLQIPLSARRYAGRQQPTRPLAWYLYQCPWPSILSFKHLGYGIHCSCKPRIVFFYVDRIDSLSICLTGPRMTLQCPKEQIQAGCPPPPPPTFSIRSVRTRPTMLLLLWVRVKHTVAGGLSCSLLSKTGLRSRFLG